MPPPPACLQEQRGDEQKALLAQHGEAAGRLGEHWRSEAERNRAAAEACASREAELAAAQRELLASRNAVLEAQAEALRQRASALEAERRAASAQRRAAAAEATADELRGELEATLAASGLPDGPLTAAGIVQAVGANAFATPAFESLTGLRWRRPDGAPVGVHEFTHLGSGFAFCVARAVPEEGADEDGDGFELAYAPLNAHEAGVEDALPEALRDEVEFPAAQMPLVLGRLLVALNGPRRRQA